MDSEDGEYVDTSEPTINDLRNWAWRTGELEWKLHAAQVIMHHQIEALPITAKDIVLLCSRRFGKSYYGCIRALMRCLKMKKQLVRIIGPTIDQTEGIVAYHMAKITAELNQIGLRGLVERVKSDKMYKVGDSAIFLGGYDSQEDSLRGGEAHEIIIEESGSSNPDQYNYQMKSILKPQLLKTRGKMVHLTTPPRVEDHPFVNDTIPLAELSGGFRKFTIYDDPLATEEIIADAIKDSGGINSIEFRREYLVEIIRDPTIVVVPDYDDVIHSSPHLGLPLKFFPQITTDFGGVRDKTVALFHFYDFFSDQSIIWDERVFEPNTETGLIVQGIREMEALWMVEAENFLPFDESGEPVGITRYVDAPGQLQIDLREHHKIAMSIVPKDDWQTAINNVAVRFSQNKVKVHSRCTFLRQTLKSGTFNKQRNDFGRTNALGHCDAIAALMYGLRVERRQNPYGKNVYNRDTTMVINHKTETQMADVIQPRVFSNNFQGTFVPRKFGSFKK